MLPTPSLQLSGERFRVLYRLSGSASEARDKAAIICLEQTVEFPAQLLPTGDIAERIVGSLEQLQPAGDTGYMATISYAVETAALELPQLLNVVFGNISIMPGIRVERLELPATLTDAFRGPRFGRAGLRERLGIARRPLLCTALKPMGLDVAALAQLAYQFALGGIDIIKDDHGLTNQPFAPFNERVRACVEAVDRANRESGGTAIYVANVTAPAELIVERAHYAQRAGAGGLLLAPGLAGLDTMRRLADDPQIGLPIMSHPAFQGSYVIGADAGISHAALFGQLARLAGADATIFPNYGGRFAFSRPDCLGIAEAAKAPLGQIAPIFPAPGGGMSLERVPEMLEAYGRDIIFLIGGGLFTHGTSLVDSARYFHRLVANS